MAGLALRFNTALLAIAPKPQQVDKQRQSHSGP
jgi:hypothetical protein